ncbi:zinc-finger domain-containing protein [Peribacillus sp. SCS-155]|uniref:zinc-finger domain-containing protein n=1 Tax=Peribacillus sedimenti TaxID=3115297 RepID=UPI0039068214
MDRKLILTEVEQVLEEYCKDCFVYSTLRKENGRSFAHKFCIRQCTVGERIKEIGMKLK